LERTTQLQGQKLGLVSKTTYQNKKVIKEVESSEVKSIPHYETNQYRGLSSSNFQIL
jgi:hypothetical protein